jgi:DNA-binding IscR family transcriptional regulator
VKGGYSFARPTAQITVLEVVELLDGTLGQNATGIFAEAADAVRLVLGEASIADVAEAEARAAGAAMYHI